ncbi:MAG: bifunctional oligoribonuclease/PAP phosphatase NrnA [Gemmatimonadota bacterium]
MTADIDRWMGRLASLLESMEGDGRVFVLTHDNPDPDALASAAAMAVLLREATGVSPRVAFGGIVGRVENRAMIQEMEIEFERIEDIDVSRAGAIAMVDTQPRAGNNSLPPGRIVSAVVDHHPARSDTAIQFTDVRPELGACASMMVQYLRAADIEPDPWLASALFYAIQAETADLSREATEEDVEASTYLYGRADPEVMSRIRHARVPASYFRALHEALAAARQYDRVVVAPLEALPYPDMVAEIADLMLQMKGIDWTVALGRYRDRLLVSVRAAAPDAHAGSLVREAFGDRGSAGGHGTFAGGQIDLRGKSEEEIASVRDDVLTDLLVGLGVDREAEVPLVPKSGAPHEEST